MFIYKITNKQNSKIYVGKCQKKNSEYFGSGILIQRAVKKYGYENFIKEYICKCNSKIQLNKKERYWIRHLDSISPKGYNIALGGDGGDLITNHPDKVLISQKISKSLKNRTYDDIYGDEAEKYRNLRSKECKNHKKFKPKNIEAWKENLKKARTGKTYKQIYGNRAKLVSSRISFSLKNKNKSEIHKLRISRSLKKKYKYERLKKNI
jgi:hypothetical protein